MTGTTANDILCLFHKWEDIDKVTLTENIEKELVQRGFNELNQRISKINDITKSNYNTIFAWLNKSRLNVKIPFLSYAR